MRVRLLRRLVTALVLAVVLLPIYWMVATSLKTNKEIRQDATLYPHAPTFNSYILLFKDKMVSLVAELFVPHGSEETIGLNEE